ncbi:helix-turn-helix domain-containing protein [Pectobacterium actinidiae]|uniref:winged helix-turn-helix transcriptional regulator n=1 Tax=Pectobacterium actinidiae TaxID=1507808 RepID=UPI002A82B588|nr:helix-turn-helix domain-containing protein [Pectobacterium actinidiae]MDY4316888.1 helix-turn-helix domain-containing protein [Pectobacterium actinidiae]
MPKTSTQVPHDAGAQGCKLTAMILDRIGDKWTVLVVGTLSHGPTRFNALMRQVGGVSHRMLTLTLRGLERDGLVKRTVYPTVPPQVEYELTTLGRSLIDPLRVLGHWAVENSATVVAAQGVYDKAQETVNAASSKRR